MFLSYYAYSAVASFAGYIKGDEDLRYDGPGIFPACNIAFTDQMGLKQMCTKWASESVNYNKQSLLDGFALIMQLLRQREREGQKSGLHMVMGSVVVGRMAIYLMDHD